MSRFSFRNFVDDEIGVKIRSVGGHGEELVCNCPFCDGVEKFYANPVRALFICYKCGERGGPIKLVQKIKGLTYKEAVRFVIEAAVRLPSKPLSELKDAAAPHCEGSGPSGAPHCEGSGLLGPRLPLALPPEFVPVFDGKSWSIPVYLKRRGIRARTAAFYGLGYCATGRYGGRIILPAHVGGELAFYQARSVTGASPKYLAPVYDRTSALWGYDEAVGADHVLVVEGPFDVLGATQAGFAAVAIMGKTISLRQTSLLRTLGCSRITVLLDPEAAKEAAEVARRLSELVEGVLVAQLPDGCDPGDAPPEVIQNAVAAAKIPGLRERLAPRLGTK